MLVGKVEKITFEGTFIRYVVRLSSQDTVVLIRPSLTEKWIDVGKKITLSFQTEQAHVFAYPEQGLAEEISV
jgi:ABC-type Fe3+/spermidine/putrescine transport system ATPase subunit